MSTSTPTAETSANEVTSSPVAEENTAPRSEVARVDSGPAESSTTASESANPNREAARYRTRLREVEAERDNLLDLVQVLQRREVERLAGERLQIAGDVFDIGGANLADLLTEAGDIDASAVAEAVAALLDLRPGLARGSRPPRITHHDFGQGRTAHSSKAGGNAWGKLLAP